MNTSPDFLLGSHADAYTGDLFAEEEPSRLAKAPPYHSEQRRLRDALNASMKAVEYRDAQRFVLSSYYRRDGLEYPMFHKLNAYAGLTLAEAREADQSP